MSKYILSYRLLLGGSFFVFIPKNSMNNFKKFLISITVLILIIVGLFFVFRKTASKEIPPLTTTNQTQTTTATLQIESTKYEAEITKGETVYDFMDKFRQSGKINLVTKNYTGIGVFIAEINGVKGENGKSWIYYVNGKLATIGVSNYKLKSGDIVLWKYENNIY